MVLSVESKQFQKTLSNLSSLIEKDEEVANNRELRNKFIEQSGLEPKEFFKTYKNYRKQQEEGRTDFRPSQFDIGDSTSADIVEEGLGFASRTAGRAVGEVTSGVKQLGKFILPEDWYKSIEETVESSLPSYVKEELSSWLDPYHGDGISATVEDIGGQIASLLIPVGAISKAGKVATKLTGKAGKSGSTAEAFINKAVKKTPVKLGLLGTNIAAVDALNNSDTDIRAIEEILENEEAAQALKKLDKNPEDREAEIFLDNFLENLKWEGMFLGGGLGAVKLYKLFKKSDAGKRTTRLGKKYIGKYFSSRQGTDDAMLAMAVERNQAARKAMTEADGLSQDLEKALKKNDFKNLTEEGQEEFAKTVVNPALAGNKAAMSQLSGSSLKLVEEMRKNIDDLSKHLGENVFKGELRATILSRAAYTTDKVPKKKGKKEFGTYINRSYRFFDEKKYKKEVKKAVQQYSAKLKKSDVTDKKYGLANLVDNAALHIRKELGDEATDKQVLDTLNRLVKDQPDNGMAFFDIITAKSLMGSSKAAKKRSDIPKDIRALWGEVSDHKKNYVNTYTKLSEMKAEDKFLNSVAGYLKKSEVEKQDVLARKGYREGMNLDPSSLAEISKKRASAIFSPKAAEEYLKDNKAIKDLYISKEYADAIRNILNTPNYNKILEYWGKAKGISQAAKTIYNPATHGANTMGNMVIMAANGMNPIGGKGFGTAFKSTLSRISKKSNKEMGQYLGKMVGYGLADSNVTLGIVRNNLNRMGKEKAFAKGLSETGVARLYEGEDFLFKAAHFEKTLDMLKKAYPDRKTIPIDDLERMAAQRTRDLMPNYNLVPRAFKALRYSPVGDFVAFPAEMARISKNLVKYTVTDFLDGNEVLKRAAMKRLGGMTGVALIPSMIEDVSARIHGIDAEQQEALNHIDKPYNRSSPKIYLSGIKKGSKEKNKYVDRKSLGNLDSFDMIRTTAKGLHEMFLTDNLNAETSKKIGLSVLDKTVGTFLGPSMLTEAIIETMEDPKSVFAYNDRTLSGAAMKAVTRYLELDTPFEWGTAATSKLLTAFEPGFATFLKNRYDYEKAKAKQYGYPSMGEAISKEGPLGLLFKEPTGNEMSDYYTPLPEATYLDLLGLKTNRLDITGSVRRNLGKPLKGIKDSDNRFIRELTNPNLFQGDSEEMMDWYRNGQRDRLREFLTLRGMLEYYNTLGVDDRDLQIGFTKYGQVPKAITEKDYQTIEDAKNNFFVPSKISDDVAARVHSATRGKFDLNKFYELQNRLYGTRIE